ISSGRPLAALESFEQAYRIEPTSEEFRINLANTLLTLSRWKAAKRVVESLTDDLPDWWASTQHDIFSAYRTARARLMTLLKLRRGNTRRLDLAGSIEAAELLAQLGHLPVARTICHSLISEYPDDLKAHLLLSRIIVELDGIDTAIDFLVASHARFEGQSDYEVVIAQLYYERGDIDKALEHNLSAGMASPAILHARGQYLASGKKWSELFALASEWMETSEDTRPYAMMLRAGRGLDRCHVFGERSQGPSSFASRTIVQFWNQEHIPQDVQEVVNSWPTQNPGFAHRLFSEATAAAYIRSFFGQESADLFAECHHPAMQSDFFRVCYLYQDGGIYLDADEVCIRPLSDLLDSFGDAEFAAWMSSDVFPYAYNGFLAAEPRSEILRLALDDMIAHLRRSSRAGVKPDIWHTTGPGLFTRALARGLKSGAVNKQNTILLTTTQYRSVALTAENLDYKLSRSGNWRLN
ncbi:MAG: tetratricopeptide repeat protein, partial [Pseudorhodoplanes sp.]